MGKYTRKYYEPKYGGMGEHNRQSESMETNGNKQNNDHGNHRP